MKVFSPSNTLYKGARTMVEYGQDNGQYSMYEYGYYRSQLWKNAASTSSCCRVFVVASKVGSVVKPKPYLFRNYNYNEHYRSRYDGTSSVREIQIFAYYKFFNCF
jgi:hypothetical protein